MTKLMQSTGVSRRKFMAWAGGAAGFAAMAAMGLSAGRGECSVNIPLDYPDPDTKNWSAWINIYKGHDGNMKLEKQSFDSWPA
jgi:hypothetical protein